MPLSYGALALVGAGEYLPPMEPIDQFLLSRLPAPRRVVCLPTAAGDEGPERLNYWNELGVSHFSRLGADVQALPVTDRNSAQDVRLANQVADANFVYLSGGKPAYLYETLQGTPVYQAIQHVLETGGVVAGCSAGAMIWGERIPRFLPPPIWQIGFGMLPNVIIVPHFDELPPMLAAMLHFVIGSGHTLLGIEGNTALICLEETCIVAGSGGVVVWDNNRKERFTAGEMVNLPGLPFAQQAGRPPDQPPELLTDLSFG